MYFLVFQPEDILKLYLHFNESQPIYVYKGYAYKRVLLLSRRSSILRLMLLAGITLGNADSLKWS